MAGGKGFTVFLPSGCVSRSVSSLFPLPLGFEGGSRKQDDFIHSRRKHEVPPFPLVPSFMPVCVAIGCFSFTCLFGGLGRLMAIYLSPHKVCFYVLLGVLGPREAM